MSKDVLYSIKSEVHIRQDSYRITKFTDGNVESSYQTTYGECDCPAGVRPSCRHRQMLPQMIAADIVNTEFFWDFDRGRAVDFSGELKSNLDAMNELAAIPGVTVLGLDDMRLLHDTIAEAVGEAQHSELQPYSPTATTTDFDSVDGGSIPSVAAKPFRRRI